MTAHLIALRHDLHRHPELSGQEAATAARIAGLLRGLGARVVTGLGGHGVAGVWESGRPGPGVLFRAELDALPIAETSGAAWASQVAGKGHLCGHDGHMTILIGLAEGLAAEPPQVGRAVLLFQPAEEDGSGAARVLADPRFAELRPDFAFAIHNMPGLPLGQAGLRAGPANCASEGLVLRFLGKTAHASQPETGLSPALSLARLIPQILALGTGGELGPDFRLVSLCHARLGAPAFGITPGEGELWLTLRTLRDGDMGALRAEVLALAEAEAGAAGLGLATSTHDRFAACTNAPEATQILAEALDALGMPRSEKGQPMRASEDFGLFGGVCRSAMVLLGAGEGHPALHNPDYDFPDALIGPGIALFDRIATRLLRLPLPFGAGNP